MKFSSLRTDPTKEAQGAWVTAGGGLRLRVARNTNAAYKDEIIRMTKPYATSIRNGSLDVTLAEEITRRAAARHLIKDWDNLEDDYGARIPFSPEKAEALFKESPDFLKMVLDFANDVELFREDGLGNS